MHRSTRAARLLQMPIDSKCLSILRLATSALPLGGSCGAAGILSGVAFRLRKMPKNQGHEDQSTSNSAAAPMPPPMHMVTTDRPTTPMVKLRFRNSENPQSVGLQS